MHRVQRLAPRGLSRSLHASTQSLAAEDGRSGSSSRSHSVNTASSGALSVNRSQANVATPPSPNRSTPGRFGAPASTQDGGQLRRGLSSRGYGKHYSPSFLNLEQHAQEPKKPRKYPTLGPSVAVAKQIDPLYKSGLHPGHPSLHDDSYKNPLLLSQYVSEMGKIKGRRDTELTRRSQREVGKAIRRARNMGLMPVMSRSFAWR